MATKDKPAATLTPLAAQRAATIKDIETLLGTVAKIDEQLIELGPGRYADETGKHVFQVIAKTEDATGAVSYAMPAGDEAVEKAQKLSGEKFSDLFDRHVTYTPCEGFALLAPKILTPAKSRDVLALCLVEGKVSKGKKAHVKAG